jgi:hypothetical protein
LGFIYPALPLRGLSIGRSIVIMFINAFNKDFQISSLSSVDMAPPIHACLSWSYPPQISSQQFLFFRHREESLLLYWPIWQLKNSAYLFFIRRNQKRPTFLKIDFQPRHRFEDIKEDFKVSSTLYVIFDEQNCVIVITEYRDTTINQLPTPWSNHYVAQFGKFWTNYLLQD